MSWQISVKIIGSFKWQDLVIGVHHTWPTENMNCETRIVRKILVESIISECFWKEIASVAVHTLTYHHYDFLLPSTCKTLIIQSKGKGKFVPVRFMKACRGNSQR
jgi:hypothetical protein